MITKEDILELSITKEYLIGLSQFHNTSCVSIFIPTHRSGEETLKGQDSLNFKNQLKEVRQKLLDKGMTINEVEKFLKPMSELVSDTDFWRHQQDGLAVLLSDTKFEKYTLPVKFTELNYLSSEFYLLPLLPLFNGNGLFHLLSLKKDEIKFYEGSKYAITEIDISDSVPARLEDRVGYDFEQRQMQNRTQQGGSFHGHGEVETREKDELLLFFRAIDKGVMSRLHGFQEPPLLVCCLDYFFSIYKEANTHKNMFPRHISCNPADLDLTLLHQKAIKSLQPYFNQSLQQKKDLFLQALNRGRASSGIKEIVPAAVRGQVDSLFVKKNSDLFGIFDPSTGEVNIRENHDEPSVSLMNLAAKKVFEQNGEVYLMDIFDMPDPTTDINALFRY